MAATILDIRMWFEQAQYESMEQVVIYAMEGDG